MACCIASLDIFKFALVDRKLDISKVSVMRCQVKGTMRHWIITYLEGKTRDFGTNEELHHLFFCIQNYANGLKKEQITV